MWNDDSPGMSVEFALATSTASRMYGIYIMLLATFIFVYVCPAVGGVYPPDRLQTFIKISVVGACVFYLSQLPYVEGRHRTCADGPIKSTPSGQEMCIVVNPRSLFKHTDLQNTATVIFWVMLLVLLFIITVLTFLHYADEDRASFRTTQLIVGAVRVVCFLVAVIFIIMAAVESGQDADNRGAEIFWYQIWSHTAILIFLFTSLIELSRYEDVLARRIRKREGNFHEAMTQLKQAAAVEKEYGNDLVLDAPTMQQISVGVMMAESNPVQRSVSDAMAELDVISEHPSDATNKSVASPRSTSLSVTQI